MLRIVVSAVVILLAWVGLALAQPVVITAPPAPARPPEPIIVPPGDHGEATRPSDADFYPASPLVRFDPAFISPLSSRTETPKSTGRVGFAGWTAPNTPVGATGAGGTGYQEVSGWFALGFAIEWDGPPPPASGPPSAKKLPPP